MSSDHQHSCAECGKAEDCSHATRAECIAEGERFAAQLLEHMQQQHPGKEDMLKKEHVDRFLCDACTEKS